MFQFQCSILPSVTSSMWPFTYCSNLNVLAYFLLQLQCTNLPTFPISMKQHGCRYQITYCSTFNAVACLYLQFNVAVYLLFQFQCCCTSPGTIQCSSLPNVLISVQQFASHSSVNAVAYLLFQILLKRSRDSLSLFCVGSSRRTML